MASSHPSTMASVSPKDEDSSLSTTSTAATSLHLDLGTWTKHAHQRTITAELPQHQPPAIAAATAAAVVDTTAANNALPAINHSPSQHNSLAPSLSVDTAGPAPLKDDDDAGDPSSCTTAGGASSATFSPICSATTPASSVGDDVWERQPRQPDPSSPGATVPRQTFTKALASVSRHNKPGALSLEGVMSSTRGRGSGSGSGPGAADDSDCPTQQARDHQHHQLHLHPGPSSASASQRLTDALNGLVLSASASASTPVTALPSLSSPCFYHQRFDDAVNIDKVLEEIKHDHAMSHSRLVQTATIFREVSRQLQRRPIKRAVRSVMIVTKARDNGLVHRTRELATWIMSTPRYGSESGIVVYVDSQLRNSRRFDARGLLEQNPRFEHTLKYWTPDLCWNQPDVFDLVLTLGGDGTVLFTSWLFQRVVPPVLSFSLGSLGFLTTFEFEKYKEHLNRVMGDDGMKINLRMRFTCTVWRAGLPGGQMRQGEQFEVLNELVIDRGPSPYVSNMELYGDDELLTVVQADGCIFSTPTGSTAYSLSAGGSLVHPDIPAILLTPICPHTLSFRPMVLSDTMALRVAIPRNSRATAHCAFDGKGRIELRQGDHVTITASQYPFPTVTRTDNEWFDSVCRTLRWNVRAASQKPFEAGAECEEDSDVWDIDTDSGFYTSEDGSVSASPIRRQMLEM